MLALHADQRTILHGVEGYIRNVAEDLQDIHDATKNNETKLDGLDREQNKYFQQAGIWQEKATILFPAPQVPTTLVQQEAAGIGDKQSLELIKDSATGVDGALQKTVEEVIEGHQYSNIEIKRDSATLLREGIRPPIAENAIQKAHDLVASTDPASIKQLWEELYQKYLDALRIGLIHETFPYWILHNIPDKAIQRMIDAVYKSRARKIEAYAPALCRQFGVPQWQFVLFFGVLHQRKILALRNVTKERTDITFDSLYRELCRIRSKKKDLTG